MFAIEQEIRERIHSALPRSRAPQGGKGAENSGAPVRWLVDPIHATHNSIRGIPVFVTLLAVERDGELHRVNVPGAAGRQVERKTSPLDAGGTSRQRCPMSQRFRPVTILAILVLAAGASGCVASPAGASPAATPSVTTPAATTASSPFASVAASPAATAPATAGAAMICDAAQLTARITLWEGAAGHRIAHVTLANLSATPCLLDALVKPQLIDGASRVLIDGRPDGVPTTVGPHAVLTTLVDADNYCGAAPTAPVTIGFVITGRSRVDATPAWANDTTVPPCLGAGEPSRLEMHPWAS